MRTLAAFLTVLGAAFTILPGLDRAPDVPLTDLSGSPARIDYKAGRLTLVNFWATWCLPCREEMPVIAKLVDEYGKRGLRAVGVAVQSGDAAGIRSFLSENGELGVNYTVLIGGDEAVAGFGDLEAVPTTFLIGPAGKVLATYVGVTEKFHETVGADIRKWLPAPAEGASKKP